MGWKRFELGLKVESAKEKAFNLFRLISRPGTEDSNDSLSVPTFATTSPTPVSSLNKPFIEAELNRAEAAAYARIFSNRPK